MTNQKKKTDEPTPAQQPATVKELLALADRLSPEERTKLEEIGAILPYGTSSLIDSDKPYKWGYRCGHCNTVGLYFAGSEKPHTGKPVAHISWVQPKVSPEKVDRTKPRCPTCGANLPLSTAGSLIARYIVDIADFEATRDKLFSREEINRQKREIDQRTAHVTEIGSQSFDSQVSSPSQAWQASQHKQEDYGNLTPQGVQALVDRYGLDNKESFFGR